MELASTQEMKRAESALIDSGVEALDLMEDAAERIAHELVRWYPSGGRCVAFLGKGNNAGDAVSILRRLCCLGWRVAIYDVYDRKEWGELLQEQWRMLGQVRDGDDSFCAPNLPESLGEVGATGASTPLVLLDGMLGLGVYGALQGEMADACKRLNEIRSLGGHVSVWAIDVPTGVNPDTGGADANAVVADFTACIGAVKRGIVQDVATPHVGRIIPISMGGLDLGGDESGTVIDAGMLREVVAPRPYEMYKNQCGHVGVVAGSLDYPGAARLVAEAALKSGAGLVTLYLLPELYSVIAPALPPEVIVRRVEAYNQIDVTQHQAMVVGSGLGHISAGTAMAIRSWLVQTTTPLVLDADALNLVAREQWNMPIHVIATPHHGELMRLLPDATPEMSRIQRAEQFTRKHQAVLVYKGARTLITQGQGGNKFYNSTGGPAMATAGQGDVLAGCIGGLLAQGARPLLSAQAAVYLCGSASDEAIRCYHATQHTLTAQTTIQHFAVAFHALTFHNI